MYLCVRCVRGVGRCAKVWEGVRRCGKVWEGVGRSRKVWEGVGRCGKVWEGVGMCEKVWEGVVWCGKVWEGVRCEQGEGNECVGALKVCCVGADYSFIHMFIYLSIATVILFRCVGGGV